MRIGIDVRYLSHGLVGGIHTYLKCLIPVLLDRGREHTFVLYADNKAPFELERAALPANASLQTLPYHNGLSSLRHDLFMRSFRARTLSLGDGGRVRGLPPRRVPTRSRVPAEFGNSSDGGPLATFLAAVHGRMWRHDVRPPSDSETAD